MQIISPFGLTQPSSMISARFRNIQVATGQIACTTEKFDITMDKLAFASDNVEFTTDKLELTMDTLGVATDKLEWAMDRSEGSAY